MVDLRRFHDFYRKEKQDKQRAAEIAGSCGGSETLRRYLEIHSWVSTEPSALESAKRLDAAGRIAIDEFGGVIVLSESGKVDHEALEDGPERNRFGFLSAAELDDADIHVDWIVDRVLAAGQPGMLVGPPKTLKTMIAIDLAVSLGGGVPFLDAYNVPEQVPVGMMSAESGDSVIQEAARRIAKCKGLSLRQTETFWAFRTPQLGSSEDIDDIQEFIELNGLRVLVIDPAYLSLAGLGDGANNLMKVGEFLMPLTKIARETGCTPILCHHSKKMPRGDEFRKPGLDDASWAGFREFSRQWILLNRRSRFDAALKPGLHELWASIGGSAGHAHEIGLDVNEGVLGSPEGRGWEITIRHTAECSESHGGQSRHDKQEQRDGEAAETVLLALQEADEEMTARSLRRVTGFGTDRIERALWNLQEDGLAECREEAKGKQTWTFWKAT